MKRQNIFIALLLAFTIVVSSSAFADPPVPNIAITSQPANLLSANQNYVVIFTVSDDTNDTVNVTVKLYVNTLNVANGTILNGNTTIGGNSHTVTFLESYLDEGDSVYANITLKESRNASATNFSLTNTITIDKSTTSVIAKDTFDGVPALGSNLGSFFSNIAPGVMGIILVLAIIGIVIYLIYVVSGQIKDSVSNRFDKK